MTIDGKLAAEFEALQRELRGRYGSGTLYEALGVNLGASAEEINRQYKKKAHDYHPDINKGQGTEQKMKDVNRVNDILSDPVKRASYDEFLRIVGVGVSGAAADARKASSRANARPGAEARSQQRHYQEAGAGSSGSSRGGSGVFVNDVELPPEFAGNPTIINGRIAISPDGTCYADLGKRTVQRMSPDGHISFDGFEIRYERRREGEVGCVTITGKGVNLRQSGGGSIEVSKGAVVTQQTTYVDGTGRRRSSVRTTPAADGLGSVVNRSYEGIRKVVLQTGTGSIQLGLSNDGKTHVTYAKGHGCLEPAIDGGKLFVESIFGDLAISLPREKRDLEIYARSATGGFKGKVAHPGAIRTATGAMDLELCAPLEVRVSRVLGDIRIENMTSRGGGSYIPPDATPTGTLEVACTTGHGSIRYTPKK